MKTLKFMPDLAKKIIDGEKWTTIRLFDDKNLMSEDELHFINRETGHIFGTAIIDTVHIKTLGTLTEEDWVGNERFSSSEAMYADFRKYYGDAVTATTEVKIITFNFEAKVYNKIVVVDENDVVLGAEYMRDAIKQGMIRRASQVYVFNESGQLLVQQRSAFVLKPLLLDHSAAGHVDAGETYEETAYRELKEELGIDGMPLELVVASFRTKDFFRAVYKMVVPDTIKISFDPEELAAIKWFDIAELEQLMAREPEKFAPAFLEGWPLLRDKLVTNYTYADN